jgi:transcriptional regulator with XRE-family HTH domain
MGKIGATHDKVLKRALQDPGVRREYEGRMLAGRLAELRQERGVTQEQLAKASGIRQSNISRLESGRVMPDWSSLWRIAEALGLDLDISFRPRSGASRSKS